MFKDLIAICASLIASRFWYETRTFTYDQFSELLFAEHQRRCVPLTFVRDLNGRLSFEFLQQIVHSEIPKCSLILLLIRWL